jgi:prevent-host-death family protein
MPAKQVPKVNVHDAKTNLSQYLARVESGESFIIAKAGKPVARLCPLQEPAEDPAKRDPRWFFGSMAGEIVFDEQVSRELDAEITTLFEESADKLK